MADILIILIMKIIGKHFLRLALLLAVLPLKAQQPKQGMVIPLTADAASTLTVYLPDQPSGRAVVALPGGGYTHLAINKEGHDWAPFFNQRGIAFFVLKYRMPHGNPSLPVDDAEKAIRMVRDSALSWHINPYDVGVMGFSAGGHLASVVSTRAAFEARPNFSLLFYPVISLDRKAAYSQSAGEFLGDKVEDKAAIEAYSTDRQVRSHLTPEAAIFLANDDKVITPLANGVAYYSAMRHKRNNCALYVYPHGGHGFGYSSSFPYHQQLLDDLSTWLEKHKSVSPQAIRVACIGNSITDGAGIDMSEMEGYPAVLHKLLGNGYNVRNFGVSARTLLNRGDYPYVKELAWRDAQAFNPNVVVLKLGTNDSKPENWQYGADFERDLLAMVDTLQSLPAHPVIYLATPIPAFKPTWNINDSVIANAIIPIIRKVARKRRCKIIDLHTAFAPYGRLMQADGIHPTAEGAAKMAEIIRESICQK